MKFNKKYTMELVEKILKIDSPSGFTKNAIDYLKKEAEHLGFKTSVTQKGNLIIEVEGKNQEAKGVCAHADTLGLMVRSIKADGKLAVTKVGGPIMNTLDGEYCRIYTRDGKVYTGTILSNSPSIHVYKDATTLERNEDTMEVRIDEIVKNKEDVEKLGIHHGDFIAIEPNVEITPSGFIKSRFLDDKLSVAILFSVLEQISSSKMKLSHKTYFMITVFEEVGHGGAWIPSDITELLGVDMGCIGTDLACTEYDVSICAKDSSGPYDYEMTSKLIDIAKKNKLNYAVDIYPMYGSDVSTALRSSNNIKGALIGPGVHASHGMERSHIQAVESSVQLLLEYVK
ncbi:M42 family metallopeptidase [Anaerorhabdus furcosa]|uniref:Putative aminopeptidase FrvX n=1 Tax=Anaerorhabdus furcosa TaxID=118967 RepID=A0A1T4MGG2_9FIRM|nr:M42 family metallopeptidase [Anaerorhabdus furcosa]SJZ65957.1 Putative aminopeptidase FrvX [Anaerorhabdus furcosa]